MTAYTSWIKSELKQHYPKADFTKGVDLNKNGRLERNERLTDANKNRVIGDHADWIAFYRKNAAPLNKIGGAFTWGKGLKPDNPIHDVIRIERGAVSAAEAKKSYKTVLAIVSEVKSKLAGRKSSPKLKLLSVYNAIKDEGITVGAGIIPYMSSQLFTRNVNASHVDCDSFSHIVLAVAHEMGWPVHFVPVPMHAFVRWDDGKTRFNFDQGTIKNDAYYRSFFSISDQVISKRIYLQNARRKEMLAYVLLANAVENLIKRRYVEAARFAKQALALNPNSAPAYSLLADIHDSKKQYKKAIFNLKKAISLDPKFSLALGKIGEVYISLKQYTKAITYLDKAAAIHPSTLFYSNRGLAKMKLGRFKEARDDLTKAIEEKHRNIITLFHASSRSRYILNSHRWRSIVNLELKSYGDALQDCNIVLRSNSRDLNARIRRGLAYDGLRRYTEAIKDFVYIVRAVPSYSFSYLYLGRIYTKMGKFRKALEQYDHAAKRRPRIGDIPYFRAETFVAMKKYGKAVKELNTLIKTIPKYYPAYLLRAKAWALVGKFDRAIADVLSAKKLNRKEVKAHTQLASYCAQAGRTKEAMVHYQKAIQGSPNNPELFYGRGKLHAKSGKHKEALADFNKAKELKHEDSTLYFYRGKSLLALKKYSKAIEDLGDFILKYPKDPVAHYFRAKAREAMGRSFDALEDYSKAISLGRTDGRTFYERGAIYASFGNYEKALVDYRRALKKDRKNAALYHLAIGKTLASLGRFQPARNHFDETHKRDASLKARREKLKLNYIPELMVDGQFRYGVGGTEGMDGRTSINSTWYLANLYRNLNLGMRIGLGYAGSPKHNMMDVDGALVLINQFASANLSVELGGGYGFLLSGDEKKSAVRAGGFFKYGLRYDYKLSAILSIGASFSLQHEMKDPRRFAIIPAVEVSANLW